MNCAAIYCRLSKEDEDKLKEGDESASIQNQKMMLVDYALEQGFTIYDIYSDEDLTGFDISRPDFVRLISDVKLKKFNIIICKTQSRFTRDMEMVEKYIHGMFPLLGIRFIGVIDHVDTNIKGNKKARQINGLINEWYSEDLSENIRGVFRAKMEKGQFLGAFACYGYLKDPEDKHHLIIDNEAADIVRRIFLLTVQGYGARQICDILFREGIPTPSAYKKAKGLKFYQPANNGSGYGLWGVSTIKKILTNRTYVGDMVQGREKKVSYKIRKNVAVPKDQWVIVSNCHEPIIDHKTFDLVQNILKQRRCSVTNKTTGERTIHLFAGKLKCKDCGASISRINGRNEGKVYLYCKLYSRTLGRLCSKHSLTLEELTSNITQRIHELIGGYLASEGTAEIKSLISLSNELHDKAKQVAREMSLLKDKIKHINKAISLLYIDKANDKIDEEEYLELKRSLQADKDALSSRLDVLVREQDEVEQKGSNNLNIDMIIHKYANFDRLTHEIVNEFIDYIEIGEKDFQDGSQEVIVHWQF